MEWARDTILTIAAKDRDVATLTNVKQLVGFVSSVAKRLRCKPVVVIDALDECKDVQKLLDGLVALKKRLRLFVTSRPLQTIKDTLLGFPSISMDDMAKQVSVDIRLHVTRELDARRRLRDIKNDIKKNIPVTLCRKAGGMFRWVQCSLDTLARCVTLHEVREALDNLPEGLEKTYERILFGIDVETREGKLALRALVWLVAALRPLTLDELMEALSINLATRSLDPDFGPMHTGALLDACGSLVTYTEKTNLIVLSHFSVKESLTGELTRAKLWQYHIDWEGAHFQLARFCFCYLSIRLGATGASGSQVAIERHSDVPFKLKKGPRFGWHTGTPRLRYSNSSTAASTSSSVFDYVWAHGLGHLAYLGPGKVIILNDMKLLEAEITRNPTQWDQMLFHPTLATWPSSEHDFTLFTLISSASDLLLRSVLRRAPLRPKDGTNPLVYAAYFDKGKHARVLLSQGAKLSCRGRDVLDVSRHVLPLEVALYYPRYAMVDLFLEEGSPVPQRIFKFLLSHHFPSNTIPLYIARRLLQTDDFVEAATQLGIQPSISQCPLISRLSLQYPETHEEEVIMIIQRLLQVGGDPFARNVQGQTLFSFAVEAGYALVTKYLLSFRAAPHLEMFLAAFQALSSHRLMMLQALVEGGADISLRTENGDSPLHLAMKFLFGKDASITARRLIEYGCDPSLSNSQGETPLRIAIGRNLTSSARYLVSIGMSIPPDSLRLALESDPFQDNYGLLSMVRFLLREGADVSVRTTEGDSLLHVAFTHRARESEALKVMHLLVPRGCDASAPNLEGTTPLHIAIQEGHMFLVRYLLAFGVPLPSDIFSTVEEAPLGVQPQIRKMLESRARLDSAD